MRERRRFPAPWRVEEIEGGFRVMDAYGRALAYVYARDDIGHLPSSGALTSDEARRVAWGIARLPELLGNRPPDAAE